MYIPWTKVLSFLLCLCSGYGLKLHNRTLLGNHNATAGVVSFAKRTGPSFRDFYAAHTTGRGIWKWTNCLDAYQRHFQNYAGAPVTVGEVGVQSGGSLLMWKSVLGAQASLFGFDINTNCKNFEEEGKVTITIGDQADPNMWQNFFTTKQNSLDILVDDGGHEANQMLVTLQAPFPYIAPGGFIAIEDIHGAHYLESFFKPAAHFLGQQAQSGMLASVHMYPFLLLVQKAGQRPDVQANVLDFSGPSTVVSDFNSMWDAIRKGPQGGLVVLKNPGWGPYLTPDGLTNFFGVFNALHDSNFVDTPLGCRTTSAAVCTNGINPMSDAQKLVTGIHVYNDKLVVEVPTSPPVIDAVRKGTEWIGYGF